MTYNKDGKAYKYTKRPKVDLMVEQLIGSGAFDSQEGRDALAACDIVITNPPFSQFRDFVNLILSLLSEYRAAILFHACFKVIPEPSRINSLLTTSA